MANNENEYLYAVRDTLTGKLCSNLTNPRKKYWQRKPDCISAINHNCTERYAGYKPGQLQLVTYKLIEVQGE